LNDNEKIAIENLDTQERLKLFLQLIESGVEVNTAFIKDEQTDVFTHQILKISCGDYATLSQPEVLATPLRPATGGELGQTVN